MNIQIEIGNCLNALYENQRAGEDLTNKLVLSPTRKEFDGDFTLVVFPLVKMLKISPAQLAEEIGQCLKEELTIVKNYNVIKGFLNLSLEDKFWKEQLILFNKQDSFDLASKNEQVLVEFSSPNTNKPLHLGHVRNILLGASTSNLLKASGYSVINTQIINDRGIAICKSMLAWQKYAGGATPESTNKKGDHFVGDYYVLFEKKFKEEYLDWQKGDEGLSAFKANRNEDEEAIIFFKRFKNQYFNIYSPLGSEAKEMLLKWEEEDQEVRGLWEKMNNWVYAGFEETYKKLGASFDILYYESQTYLLGKDAIDEGLKKNLFYKKNDGSVWIDLSDVGLDEKLVLRSDGTSVYMTQDIGTVEKRFENHGTKKMIYTVANEQDYHFKALFAICKKLNKEYADGLFHLSYGMVDLPSGKMKSREGTVVDADDLIEEVICEAASNASEREVTIEIDPEEQKEINRKVGLGALKYFILKVNPKKRMVFDPKESVDMQGDTGPYIQNAYVRIQSIMRKEKENTQVNFDSYQDLNEVEKDLLSQLMEYPQIIDEAAEAYDPSKIASFAYQLARSYHRFYHDVSILRAESPEAKSFRLSLSREVAKALKHAFNIIGIEMPEKM